MTGTPRPGGPPTLRWAGGDPTHTPASWSPADPQTLPDKATWYLATNLPRPGGPHDTPDSRHEPGDLTEIVRLYGIRHWIEQSYKHVKDELGWADFQVRSATAIRRHQTLVHCAFSFCWNTWFDPPAPHQPPTASPQSHPDDAGERGRSSRPAHRLPMLAKALRAVRAWLLLQRWWKAWSDKPPPDELQHLLNALAQGHAINLYLPP